MLENKDYELLLGDFREVGKQIPDNSIDMIFTDPPYKNEFLHLYEALAKFASEKLKDGGKLITYTQTGQIPQIINYLEQYLTYVAVIGLEQVGHVMPLLWKYRIFPYLKFLLFYSNGSYKPRGPISNFIASKYQGKRYHNWQQSTLEAVYCIAHLTEENDLVCDPFMGSGTTALACMNKNRKFIGIEIDPETFKIAEKRISEARKSIPISQYMSD